MELDTRVGWVLLGPVHQKPFPVSLTLCAIATITKSDDTFPMDKLEDTLRRFWDLESLGIMPDKASVYAQFIQKIVFTGGHYQVSLPWIDDHPPVVSNYDAIIQDQLSLGVVKGSPRFEEAVHFLPHHAVIRRDKSTSKLRVVYDASVEVRKALSQRLFVHWS